jgi:hypothetical protein
MPKPICERRKKRINISRGIKRAFPAQQFADDAHGVIVRSLVEIARTLPEKHFAQLREQLEDIWS